MKTKLLKSKFTSTVARSGWLFGRLACSGAVILICSSAAAQNLFVSGKMPPKNCAGECGIVSKFTWDGRQSIFATQLTNPGDLAFDSAGNLFVVDYSILKQVGNAVIYKITPTGVRTIFASGLGYPSYVAVDRMGKVFVADYNQGIIYEYKPTGSRGIFASGLYHPVGMAFDSAGNLYVADNSIGNIYQGSIYQYKTNRLRTTFAVLQASDRPADLAFDSLGNLLVADLGGKIYKYSLAVPLRPHARTIFGSVPGSAESLAFDTAGNLFVVDAGGVNSAGTAMLNGIYKFTQQGVRSTFASAFAKGETFTCLTFPPMACCQ